jgi:hypothetical protein
MKAKREQAYGDLLVIKLFASNYARDLMYNTSLNLIGDNCGFTKKEIVKKRKQLLLKPFKKIYYIGYLIY